MRVIMILIISVLLAAGCKGNKKRTQSVEVPVAAKDSTSVISETVSADTIKFSKVSAGVSTKHPWVYKWNHFISSEIKNYRDIFIAKDTIYKDDLLKLCPDFYSLSENDKIAVWTLLIASVARYESNFDPDCRFREDASLNYVYSEGLLQLSYGDETRYKNVPLDPAKKNILDPEVNLRTGVVILARQLVLRKTIFTAKHFYWSVLTNKQKEIIRFFKDNIKDLDICSAE